LYYDLRAARRERGIDDVALVRLEQLYPFPHDEFKAEIERYTKAKEIVWCQEEPGNQGRMASDSALPAAASAAHAKALLCVASVVGLAGSRLSGFA
jgi:2-oxoglutarate dehydrogenase complex dehydrogenase (E1) component-like enzyme